MTIVFKLWNKSLAKLAKWTNSIGLTKNEKIVVGEYKYPIAEFLAISDEKILDILKSAGGSDEQIDAAFAGINEMRKN